MDIASLRAQFPILAREVHGKPLVYFDSANTAQKPLAVIAAVDDFYRRHNANVARAVHTLSEEATTLYETAREKIAAFIGAPAAREVVLTSGTTMAINLVALGYLRPRLKAGDEIVVSQMEHHANIVPWQLLCAQTGAVLKVAPIDDDGTLDLPGLLALLGPRTKLVGLAHVSNVLGTVNPVAEVAAQTRARGIPLLVDGSQAVPHFPVDVRALGCDFYVFTGHKLYGPTGTGALWGRFDLLDAMSPVIGGGEMIESVSFDGTVYAPPPRRFEAGTPNIAGFVGLAAAIDWLQSQDWPALRAHEDALGERLRAGLRATPGVRFTGDARERVPVVSFVVEGAHATDLAVLLDLDGIAVRSGQHCAHPLMQRFGVGATTRASLAFYNTADEVDRFLAALVKVRGML
ncbi:MAG: SufS family cysteine desulfurase [Rhodanobacteraceae bacterium]|nr:SufS family cysteine desulfurase [Rhodanobacteraceae bacterium]